MRPSFIWIKYVLQHYQFSHKIAIVTGVTIRFGKLLYIVPRSHANSYEEQTLLIYSWHAMAIHI